MYTGTPTGPQVLPGQPLTPQPPIKPSVAGQIVVDPTIWGQGQKPPVDPGPQWQPPRPDFMPPGSGGPGMGPMPPPGGQPPMDPNRQRLAQAVLRATTPGGPQGFSPAPGQPMRPPGPPFTDPGKPRPPIGPRPPILGGGPGRTIPRPMGQPIRRPFPPTR